MVRQAGGTIGVALGGAAMARAGIAGVQFAFAASGGLLQMTMVVVALGIPGREQ